MILKELIIWMVGTVLTVSALGILAQVADPKIWGPIAIILLFLWVITLISRVVYLSINYKKYLK